MNPDPPVDGDRPEPDGAPRPWDVPPVEGSSVESARDAVPEAVRDAARRAFDAGPADTEIADLLFDSVLDNDSAAVPAADPRVRTLRFRGADGERGAGMTVSEGGRSVAITLAVVPPASALVEVRSKGPTFSVRTGDNGVIRFDVPPGLVSVVITPVHSLWPRPLQTAWVRL